MGSKPSGRICRWRPLAWSVEARFSALLLVLCLCMLLGGCLTIEQAILIRDDYTLMANYTYTYPSIHEGAVDGALATLTGASPLDERAVRRHFAGRNAEVTVYKKTVRGDRTSLQVVVVARDAAKAVNAGAFGTMKLERREGGMRLEAVAPGDAMDGEHRELLMEKAARLCNGAGISFVVSVPGSVTGHNGKAVGHGMVGWNYAIDGDGSIFDAPDSLFVEWEE